MMREVGRLKCGLLTNGKYKTFPTLSSLLTEHAEKKKHECTLKRIEDRKEYLKRFPQSRNRDGENSKEPSEPKENHNSTEPGDSFDDLFVLQFMICLRR